MDASENEGGGLRAHQEWSSGEHAGKHAGGGLQFAVLLFGEDDAVGVFAKEIPPTRTLAEGLNVKVIVTVGSSMKRQDFTRAYMHRPAHVHTIQPHDIFDS